MLPRAVPSARGLSLLLLAFVLVLDLRAAAALPAGAEAFLDDVQKRTFRWFWENTDAATGLVPDRAPQPPFSSIAAIGFGLTAYGVGAERGYVSRPAAAERTLATLRFLSRAPMGPAPQGTSGHRGFYYHFLQLGTGHRYKTNELSSIDTALLMLGVLFSREYFDRDEPRETEIRALAEKLYRRVEWSWMADTTKRPEGPLLRMAWRPESGFGDSAYQGFDEALFLYALALGSPTHPVPAEAWDAYTASYIWGRFHGQEFVQFGPLFGYQYAHVWIDPRGLQDAFFREKGIDAFTHSRRATYANRAHCIANPGGFADYGPDIWGLSASDGPAMVNVTHGNRTLHFSTYEARGASIRHIHDDGTLTPTAAGGSVPFAPEIAIPALMAMRARYGDLVYNRHGFVDAFNPTYRADFGPVERGTVDPQHGWFDRDQLGIDQGPILLMIENNRTRFIWETMRRSPHLVRGLARAGFTAPWLADAVARADE